MARYIDADLLRNEMEELYEHHLEMKNFCADGAVSDCLYFLDNAPTADVVEVKHGKWTRHKPNKEHMKKFHDMGIGKSMSLNSIYWTCSCCNNWGTPRYNLCPYCGAKMDSQL